MVIEPACRLQSSKPIEHRRRLPGQCCPFLIPSVFDDYRLPRPLDATCTMNWTDFRGHDNQIAMLRRSVGRGRLAHACLFAGPPGVGKSRFARIFAQCLLCSKCPDEELESCGDCSSCRQMNAGSHPDFFHVGCPEGKSNIPVELFKGSKDGHGQDGLIHDLSLRPMVADRRVAVIDDANRMNDEGANAMLKTLEEPPPNSLLILIAENLDAVLPTIRSRCQLIRFSPLANSDVVELLVANELCADRSEASAVAAMSDGSLETATQLLNPELRSMRQSLYGFLSGADFNPLEAAKTMTAGLDALGSETHEQRRNAGWLIRFAQEFYRQVVLHQSNDSTAVEDSDAVAAGSRRFASLGEDGLELAMELFDRCVLAESQIDWNINPARSIEALFDDLARTARNRRASVS